MIQPRQNNKHAISNLRFNITPVFIAIFVFGTLLCVASSDLIMENASNDYDTSEYKYLITPDNVTNTTDLLPNNFTGHVNQSIINLTYNDNLNGMHATQPNSIDFNNKIISNLSSENNETGRWSSTDLAADIVSVSTHRQLTRSALDYIDDNYLHSLDELIKIPAPGNELNGWKRPNFSDNWDDGLPEYDGDMREDDAYKNSKCNNGKPCYFRNDQIFGDGEDVIDGVISVKKSWIIEAFCEYPDFNDEGLFRRNFGHGYMPYNPYVHDYAGQFENEDHVSAPANAQFYVEKAIAALNNGQDAKAYSYIGMASHYIQDAGTIMHVGITLEQIFEVPQLQTKLFGLKPSEVLSIHSEFEKGVNGQSSIEGISPLWKKISASKGARYIDGPVEEDDASGVYDEVIWLAKKVSGSPMMCSTPLGGLMDDVLITVGVYHCEVAWAMSIIDIADGIASIPDWFDDIIENKILSNFIEIIDDVLFDPYAQVTAEQIWRHIITPIVVKDFQYINQVLIGTYIRALGITHGVDIETEESNDLKTVHPGDTAIYSIVIRNLNPDSREIAISFPDVPDDWDIVVDGGNTLQFEGYEKRFLNVYITPDDDEERIDYGHQEILVEVKTDLNQYDSYSLITLVKKPNLIARDIEISESPIPGDEIIITGYLQNGGGVFNIDEVDVKIVDALAWPNEVILCEDRVIIPESWQKTTLNCIWMPPDPVGIHEFRFIVDYSNLQEESHDFDNSVSINIGWGPEIQFGRHQEEYSDAVVDEKENVHRTWSYNGKIFYKAVNKHGNVIIPKTLVSYNGDKPRIILDSLSNAFILFIDSDRNLILNKILMDRTQWLEGEIIISRNVESCYKFDVDNNNNAHVIWNVKAGDIFEQWYSKIDENGQILVEPDKKTEFDDGGSNDNGLDVFIDLDNFIHVTWEIIEESTSKIYYSKWDNNGNYKINPVQVNDGIQWAEQPRIECDNQGFPHMIWQSLNEENECEDCYHLFYNYFDNIGNKQLEDQLISHTPIGNNEISKVLFGEFDVSISSDIGIVIAWLDKHENSDEKIYETHYIILDSEGLRTSRMGNLAPQNSIRNTGLFIDISEHPEDNLADSIFVGSSGMINSIRSVVKFITTSLYPDLVIHGDGILINLNEDQTQIDIEITVHSLYDNSKDVSLQIFNSLQSLPIFQEIITIPANNEYTITHVEEFTEGMEIIACVNQNGGTIETEYRNNYQNKIVLYNTYPMLGGPPNNGGFTHAPGPNDVSENIVTEWEFTGQSIDDPQPIYSTPAVMDGSIVFGTIGGYLYSIKDDMMVNWVFQVPGENNGIISSPAIGLDIEISHLESDLDVIVFGSENGIIYCLELQTGKHIWEIQTFGRIYSSPIIQGSVAYIGSNDNNIYSIDISIGIIKWKFSTGNSVRSNPSYHNGFIVFTSDDGNLYVLNADNGDLMWRKKMSEHYGRFRNSPMVYNNIIFIVGNGGHPSDWKRLFALDLFDGSIIWMSANNNLGCNDKDCMRTPIILNDIVIVGSDDNFASLYSYKINCRGYQNHYWRLNLNKSNSILSKWATLSLTPKYIIYPDKLGRLFAIDYFNKQIAWIVEENMNSGYSTAVAIGESIYIATGNGKSLKKIVANKPPESIPQAHSGDNELKDLISIHVGDSVYFDGSTSLDPENDELTFSWDFDGDGVEDSHEMIPKEGWIFNDIGQHTVTLSVQDRFHTPTTNSLVITTTNTAPEAIGFGYSEDDFSLSKSVMGHWNRYIGFDGSSYSYDPDGDVLSYKWDFDWIDGYVQPDSIISDPTHYYYDTGVFQAVLCVTDGYDEACDSITITLTNEAPIAVAYSEETQINGEYPIRFFGDESYDPNRPWDNIDSYYWQFRDGSSSVEQNPWHSYYYASPGDYHVLLTVSDGNLEDTTSDCHIEVVPRFDIEMLNDDDDLLHQVKPGESTIYYIKLMNKGNVEIFDVEISIMNSEYSNWAELSTDRIDQISPFDSHTVLELRINVPEDPLLDGTQAEIALIASLDGGEDSAMISTTTVVDSTASTDIWISANPSHGYATYDPDTGITFASYSICIENLGDMIDTLSITVINDPTDHYDPLLGSGWHGELISDELVEEQIFIEVENFQEICVTLLVIWKDPADDSTTTSVEAVSNIDPMIHCTVQVQTYYSGGAGNIL